MDLAQSLIRSAVRAFYETKHVLVIDALMTHSALPNEDLALLLGMQPKDLRKLCGRLREDRFIAVYSRQETREGQLRPIHKDYYYVNYHATIDAVKYRIHRLSNQVSDLYKPSEQRKDFYCPRCQARYDQLEVLHNVDQKTGFFLCNRCTYQLERDEESTTNGPGHERSSQLNAQLGKFLEIMGQIDEQDIPANDFESAIAIAIPVNRNEDINPRQLYSLIETRGVVQPIAVKGVTQLTSTPLEISLTTTDENSAVERAAETQRKADLAAQNALPVWHTMSTITGETTALGEKERERLQKFDSHQITPDVKAEEEEADSVVLDDELTAYYTQMQREKEKSAQEDQEESSDSQDYEDDFEDVGGADSTISTPIASHHATIHSTSMVDTLPGLENSHLKTTKPESETDSSGLGSLASTPANVQERILIVSDEDLDERLGKRMKFGTSDVTDDISTKDEVASLEDDGIDDEGAEFEDALPQ